MKIGLISDTHNVLNPKISEHFAQTDLILHAGDIGSMAILGQLRKVAPTHAIRGNMDSYNHGYMLPEILQINLKKINFLIIHDIGSIAFFCRRLDQGFYAPRPDVIIFGHTHQPLYEEHPPYLFINPGSASFPRNTPSPTIMTIEANDNRIVSRRIIEL